MSEDVLAEEYLAARWAGMQFIGCYSESTMLLEAAEFTRLGGGGDIAARAIARVMRDCVREDGYEDGSYIVNRRGRRLSGGINARYGDSVVSLETPEVQA